MSPQCIRKLFPVAFFVSDTEFKVTKTTESSEDSHGGEKFIFCKRKLVDESESETGRPAAVRYS